MTTALYDVIGSGYSKYRRADSRIADTVFDLLDVPFGSVIADIGAGTGNYSRALADRGLIVKAVESASVMWIQAVDHPRVDFVAGTAENVPLADRTVDGVVSILSVHHFTSTINSFWEMARICAAGPLILFTFDLRHKKYGWVLERKTIDMGYRFICALPR